MHKLGGMNRSFCAILSIVVAVGCGGPRSSTESGASAPPPTSTPTTTTATDPSTGAGNASSGPPDAGPPPAAPDCSPNAPLDASCFDPGTPAVAISQSDAPQCAAFLPVAVPEPVLFTMMISGAPGTMGIGDIVPDGDGHLGIGTFTAPAYPGQQTASTIVMAPGGKTLFSLPGVVTRSTTHGFLTEVSALEYGQVDTLSAWNGGAIGSLEVGRHPYPFQPDPPFCSWAAAPDSTITAACWSAENGASLRHFDAALVETMAAAPLPERFWLDRIDEQGRLLTSEGVDTVRWRNPDGSALSEGIAGAGIGRLQPLVGGGFDTARGVLPSGSTEFLPKPQWLEQRRNGDLSLVRGRRAYAFAPYAGPTEDCTRRFELLAPDGTVCATVGITEPTCSPGAPADRTPVAVGAEGTLSENVLWLCRGDSCLVAWRVWNHILQ